MPISCTNDGCQVKLPYSHFISTTYSDFTRRISSDCSQNVVLLTDDPGLVDQADSMSGDYLTADNRRVGVFSSDDVATHWAECSRTYQELAWFFNAPRQRGYRPSSITVAFKDAGESWVDAYNELVKCFRCFRWVTHVSHDVNDTAFHDMSDQIDLALLARADRKIPVLPTADQATLASDFTETGSIPGQAGASNVGASWALMWQDDGCTYSCTASDGSPVTKAWYQPDHIMLAAVGASYGYSDATYNWTSFMKPPGGWPGAKTSQLSQNEIINVTGVHPDTGYLIDAARSVNVYVGSQASTSGFIEGFTDDGYFIDDIAKRYAIEESLIGEQLQFLHNAVDNPGIASAADLRQLDTLMISKVGEFISKNMVLDRLPASIADNLEDYPDYQWSSIYDNIIAGGDGYGWVLARQELQDISEAEQSQRFGAVYFFCFIPNRPLHRARIQICATLKPISIA